MMGSGRNAHSAQQRRLLTGDEDRLASLKRPLSWELWTTETNATLSVAVQTEVCTGALFLDLRTRERVLRTASEDDAPRRERGQVALFLRDLAAIRDQWDAEQGAAVMPLPRMVAARFESWTPMQQLAAGALGWWIPPPTFGAHTPRPDLHRRREFRRVNQAIARRRATM